jgi:hypothetical protein
MSIALQPQSIQSELVFFEAGAEGEGEIDSSLPDQNLKTSSKNYTLTPKEQKPIGKQVEKFSQLYSKSNHTCSKNHEKHSPMQLIASKSSPVLEAKKENISSKNHSYSSPPHKMGEDRKSSSPTAEGGKQPQSQSKEASHAKSSPSSTALSRSHSPSQKEGVQARDASSTSQNLEKNETLRKEGYPLLARQWRQEETKKWWEVRYHQRERGGERQKRDQEEHEQESEQKKFQISKIGSIHAKSGPSHDPLKTSELETGKKPYLPPPSVGVFALYYILTKIGIFSDGTSNFAYKKEIELIDTESTELHKKRIEELKEGIKKEQETANWGVASKVFSWMASFLAIIAGILLIATGVGAVAGAMIVVGGLIQITNQILEITGGWKKIAAILPGDDSEKKRAVLNWMQIGIAVLCLILSGAGVIWGGFTNFGTAMSTASAMIGGIASGGYGITSIGEGIASFLYKDKIGDIKKHEMLLTKLKHKRKDLMENMEIGIDRLEQLFEDLARSLQFEEELFRADQMVIRR